MRWLVVPLLLLVPVTVKAGDTAYVPGRPDHVLHTSASFFGTLALSEVYTRLGMPKLLSPYFAGMTVLTLGAVKENLDPQFSLGDMKANTVGVLGGMGVYYAIQF
jgi:hypothetical protein